MLMSPVGFQKTSLSWQMRHYWRQVSEWLEALLASSDTPTVDWQPNLSPTWLQILLLTLLGLCLWLGLRTLLPRVVRMVQYYRSRLQSSQTLPSPSVTAATWLKQAQAYQQRGNYREACRSVYLAMLQRLDETQRVPQSPSRTDGEYRTIVTRFQQPTPYITLLTIHERLCFSNATISNEEFQTCRQAYRELDQA